jgi:hypothetical protein
LSPQTHNAPVPGADVGAGVAVGIGVAVGVGCVDVGRGVSVGVGVGVAKSIGSLPTLIPPAPPPKTNFLNEIGIYIPFVVK